MSGTIDYYNKNADNFIETTQNVDMHPAQERFLALLSNGSTILDFGCGSGRDTRYFLDKGHLVDAVDGSAEICRRATEFTGISVKPMLFQELSSVDRYDGIWACASVLHLSKSELRDVFSRMIRALKDKGVIYASFKYGTFEGERRGRYFTDFTEDTFGKFMKPFSEIIIEECWLTSDVRPDRADEKWLNLLLRKR